MWYSEWLDPNYLAYWPFAILTEKATLRLPLKKKKIVGNANLYFYSGHCWILRASELTDILVLAIQQFTVQRKQRVFLQWTFFICRTKAWNHDWRRLRQNPFSRHIPERLLASPCARWFVERDLHEKRIGSTRLFVKSGGFQAGLPSRSLIPCAHWRSTHEGLGTRLVLQELKTLIPEIELRAYRFKDSTDETICFTYRLVQA